MGQKQNMEATQLYLNGFSKAWTLKNILDQDLLNRLIIDSEMFSYYKTERVRTSRPDRIYMHQYPNIASFTAVCGFLSSFDFKKTISMITDIDFTRYRSRIELCRDDVGSWLRPHTDNEAKHLTLQIYLSDSNNSTVLGDYKDSATVNSGWMFVNTGKELHQLPPLQVRRTSIILNYVDTTWRDHTVVI
jgi:hypothetical protein